MRICVKGHHRKGYCYTRPGKRKSPPKRKQRTGRRRTAKKAYCVPGTLRRYKGRCGCKTRGGGFKFVSAGRCKR
jgi:hypothetical protein